MEDIFFWKLFLKDTKFSALCPWIIEEKKALYINLNIIANP